MRKKFLRLVCICAMVSSLVMGGCGDTQETKGNNSTNEAATTKENDTKEDIKDSQSGEYPYGTFDVDEICKHIEINGKQVDFPFTLNDLGEDYEFSRCDDVSKKDIINICGIQKGIGMEKVIEVFGQPTKISEGSFMEMYIYQTEKGMLTFSYFTDDRIVKDISIRVSGLEQEEN
ncbi:MAG: hypothetical protein K2M73_04475 [Lachnospiraceae bacterium]|nr:hypothetical protein [Lachnospiraceae bacterium]